MKRKVYSLTLIFLLCSSTLAQVDSALFNGIDDPKILAFLKSDYGKPNRWNVPPQDGRFLYDLILAKGYKHGLEIGTSNGYSGLWLGLALKKNGGALVTIEIDTERAREAQERFHEAGLNKVIELRIADALAEIPKLKENFDFVFIDAWKPDYKKYLDLVYPQVSVGGAITAHNVISQASGMDDFLQAIKNHPKLVTTIHKTSSEGVSVSLKKP